MATAHHPKEGITPDNVIRRILEIPDSNEPLTWREVLRISSGQKATRKEANLLLLGVEQTVEQRLREKPYWERIQAVMRRVHTDFLQALEQQRPGTDAGSSPDMDGTKEAPSGKGSASNASPSGHGSNGRKGKVKPAVAEDAAAEGAQAATAEKPTADSDGAIQFKVSKRGLFVALGTAAALGAAALMWKATGKSHVPAGADAGPKPAPTSEPPKGLAQVPQPVPVVPADAQKGAVKNEPMGQSAVVQKVTDEVKPAEKKASANPFPANPVAPVAEATPEPIPEPAPTKPETAVASLTPSKQPIVPAEGRTASSETPTVSPKDTADTTLPFHAQKKRAVPSEESLVALRQSVQNDSEISGMDPKDVIRALISKATKEKNADLAWAYLMEGYQRGLSQGDLVSALVALNSMAAYDVDSSAMSKERVKAVKGIINRASGKERVTLLQQLPQILQNAIFQDDYAAVLELSKQYGAQLSKQPGARDAVKGLMDRAKALKKSYDSLGPVREKLQENPNDPEANQAMGEFYCFEKDDWETGLPHLGRSADAQLRSLAVRMSQGSMQQADLLSLAKDWRGYASQMPNARGMVMRAAYTYARRAFVRAKPGELAEARAMLQDSSFHNLRPISFAGLFMGNGLSRGLERSINLLSAQAVPLEGSWSKDPQSQEPALVGKPAKYNAALLIPCEEVEDRPFKFKGRVQHLSGRVHHVIFNFPLGDGRNFDLSFDMDYGRLSGIRQASDNSMQDYSDDRKKSLADGKPMDVEAYVVPRGSETFISVFCNGELFAEWMGPRSMLKNMQMPEFSQARAGKTGIELRHAWAQVRYSDMSLQLLSNNQQDPHEVRKTHSIVSGK